ncbi:cytochrome P450 [Nonomuraea sp. NPDC047897]|uniref:cytochrome P450 n=1 Tax=Nonomuraea sp. NPDC047897 TaxID=3364346 RepID=UPI00371FF58A
MSPTRSPDVAPPHGVTALPHGMGWVITNREIAVRLLSDDRLGVVESAPVVAALSRDLPADVRPLAEELGEFADRIMLQAAPERHAELRRAFGRFFTADAVDARIPAMRASAERLVEKFAGEGGGEFMTEVAFRYAIDVGSQLVGLPAAQFSRLHKLSQRLAMVAYASRLSEPTRAVREGHAALIAIRASIAQARSTAPKDSVLGSWNRGETGDLSDADFEANAVMLVQATLETVAGMLGNAAVRILGTPGALAVAEHRAELLDEALRHEPPLKTLERVVREPVSVDGFQFGRGQVISVQIAEANQMSGGGEAVAGRAVLSFGWGPYRCLGARMARHQALELFSALNRLAPDSTLAEPETERVRHIRFDMPRRLLVRCSPAPGPLLEALTDALAEHDLDRPLTSIERVVAGSVLGEFGHAEPEAVDAPRTIREWVTWAEHNRG